MHDPRKDAPSFHRNIEPIITKLHEVMSHQTKRLLEISSGSGQHVARFANEFPSITFQPTEYDVENLPSIDAWANEKTNVLPALHLDVLSTDWFEGTIEKFDTIFCANVIHITPWEVTEALFNGATKYLNTQSQIILYGPYKVGGKQTSESNAQFELWLKERDQRYAIRDIDNVSEVAARHGFTHEASHDMPANNFIQMFARG